MSRVNPKDITHEAMRTKAHSTMLGDALYQDSVATIARAKPLCDSCKGHQKNGADDCVSCDGTGVTK